ncbi:MAG: dihydroorotate dehydrogenase [Oscillospiraceae bacterium]|nr:dihydroorotate dehydrogenase [Oscillospiraceae bacterium]
MTDLRVNLAGVMLKNPIVVASGTFGFGHEFADYYDLSELGAICAKGLTVAKKDGNPPPRIAETPSGILNSVGLQNPGVDYFCAHEMPYLKQSGTKIIANISGNTLDEFTELAEKVSAAGVDLIEVNISCPNVKCGGLAWGTQPESAAAATAAVKKAATVPVIVKLSPNVTDITAIARAVEAAGADAVSLINTILGMRIDVNTRRPVLRNNMGGLSGPAVLPVAVRMIYQVACAVKIPILGMGGVASGADAAELMLAGATAVAVGTALFQNPYAPIHVRDELQAYLEQHNIPAASALTGAVMPY